MQKPSLLHLSLAIPRLAFALGIVLLTRSVDGQNVTNPGTQIRVDRIDPSFAPPGTNVTVHFHGTNFQTETVVFIDKFVTGHKLSDPGHLEATVRIPAGARLGPRDVVLSNTPPMVSWLIFFHKPAPVPPGFLQPCILANGFNVALAAVNPDLVLLPPTHQEYEQAVGFNVRVANMGHAASLQTHLHVEADCWESRSVEVPPINIQKTNSFKLTLPIPDAQRGKSTIFTFTVDPVNEPNDRTQNKRVELSVRIPSKREVSRPTIGGNWNTRRLLIVAGTGIVVAACALAIPHLIKSKRREEWQQKAKKQKPELPGRDGELYCYKRRVEASAELNFSMYRVERLLVIPRGSTDDNEDVKVTIDNDVVGKLNQAVAASCLTEGRERLKDFLIPTTEVLLRTMGELLEGRNGGEDISVVAQLAGSKVEFEFTLYRCKKEGTAGVWEKEDSWKARVEDKREEPITTLHSVSARELSNTSQTSGQLTNRLLDFIKKV